MLSSIVLACVIVQTAIALYLINSLKQQDAFEKRLNAILCMLVFHLGTKFFILTVLKNSYLYNNNATGFSLSYGPLIYIIVRDYIKRPLTPLQSWLHLLPFSVGTLLYLINGTLFVLYNIRANIIQSHTTWYHWCTIVSLCVYPLITRNLLRRYSQGIVHQKKLLISITHILLGSIMVGIVVDFVHVIRTGILEVDLRLIPYICLSVLPVLILRYKLKTQATPREETPVANTLLTTEEKLTANEKPVEKQYKKSALDEQMMDEYEKTLQRFMQQSRIYLEADISLEGLASQVNIPKHHVTQLLNERFGKNFYTYINEHRIAEAIEKLKNPASDESILSLAYDCGFNSKSSFNSYFKKLTGHTPSMYRKEYMIKLNGEEHLTP